MQRCAIVLGGTNDHIELVEDLQNRGYRVVVVDYLAHPPAAEVADEHIQESTLDKDKVVEIAKAKNASIVATACIDQALTTMAYVCELLGLPCHVSYLTASALTNKSLMKARFLSANIPTTKYMIIKYLLLSKLICYDFDPST